MSEVLPLEAAFQAQRSDLIVEFQRGSLAKVVQQMFAQRLVELRSGPLPLFFGRRAADAAEELNVRIVKELLT
jgi:hypothetical protein